MNAAKVFWSLIERWRFSDGERWSSRIFGEDRKIPEASALVVYANSIVKKDESDPEREKEEVIPFMKGYTVFNVEQIEGLPSHYYAVDEAPAPEVVRLAAVDSFVKNKGAVVRQGGDKALYANTPQLHPDAACCGAPGSRGAGLDPPA